MPWRDQSADRGGIARLPRGRWARRHTPLELKCYASVRTTSGMDPDAIDRMVRNMPARSGTTAATRRHLHHHRPCTRRPLEDEQKRPGIEARAQPSCTERL
jgi:hypothetical protein